MTEVGLTGIIFEFDFNPVYMELLPLFKHFGIYWDPRTALIVAPIPDVKIALEGRKCDVTGGFIVSRI